jgi:hypothetical protein
MINNPIDLFIYSIEGKLLKTYKAVTSNESYYVGDLPTGVYILNTKLAGVTKNSKIIISE